MAEVRSYTSGVPSVAMFADLGWPLPGGTPIVVDTATGNAYVLIAGVVTLLSSGTFQPLSAALTDLSSRWTVASSSGPASLDFREDADNGTSRIRLIAPSSLSTDFTNTLPGADMTLIGTSVGLGSTDNLVPRAQGTGGADLQAGVSMTMNDDGSVVNTAQPAVIAYLSANMDNAIGTAATGFVTVVYNTEILDQTGDFNSSTGTFTAPVSGTYSVGSLVALVGMTAANDGTAIVITTSNFTYAGQALQKNNFIIDTSIGLSASGDVYMDANDTLVIKARSIGEATNVVDIYGEAAPTTWLSVRLAT